MTEVELYRPASAASGTRDRRAPERGVAGDRDPRHLRYALTLDELVDGLMRLSSRHQRFGSRRRGLILWLFVFALAFSLFYRGWVVLPLDREWLVGGALVVLALIAIPVTILIFGLRVVQRRMIRRYFSRGRNVGLTGERELNLTDAGLEGRSEAGVSLTYWTAIEGLTLDRHFVMIHLPGATAYLVPRSGVLAGDLDGFVAALEEQVGPAERVGPARRSSATEP